MTVELKPEKLMTLFEDLAERLNIELVLGTGDFIGGLCTLKDQKYLVVNKNHPMESRIRILAHEFNSIGVSDVYLVPALREFIDEISAIPSPN
jgi:hypothetical protein